MFIVIGILVFGMIAALVVVFVGESRAVRVQERVEAVGQNYIVRQGTSLDGELSKSIYQRLIAPALSRLRDQVMGLMPSQAIAATRHKIDQAGSPRYLRVSTFLTIKVASAAVGVVGFLALVLMWPGPLLPKVVMAGGVLAIGALAPDYFITGMIRNRQNQIRKALPDIIDLLVVSAEAGTGLDGALAVVTKRKDGPLPDEFSRVLTEMRLGKARQQAWADMADRVDLMEMRMLVAALRQAEQLGVSIANTLRTQSDSLRNRRSIRIRQLAATLSVKMLFPLIFCILPALFIVVLGPALMSITGAMESIGW